MTALPPLAELAREIWCAGVASVRSDLLVTQVVQSSTDGLHIAGEDYPWSTIGRVLVVGAGKAGAGMVTGLETCGAFPVPLSGSVHVPDDCVIPTRDITLYGARPPGYNLPTERGVSGARNMLRLVRRAAPNDLCLVLLSGGGSALLPAPRPGISLPDKVEVTRTLSAAGADIRQLNIVRTALSDIKGGKLAAACRAARCITLVISDVLGDPLDIIASGPTYPSTVTDDEAREILESYQRLGCEFPAGVMSTLQAQHSAAATIRYPSHLRHAVIGNNATAVAGAARRARELGFDVRTLPAEPPTNSAEQVGTRLAEEIVAWQREATHPICLVWGGEPTVTLCPAAQRGQGGRNQQLVLSALQTFWERSWTAQNVALLSGGTDGEDGPTDAAGAWFDGPLLEAARAQDLPPQPFLVRNDAYTYFERCGGLWHTGPTHTNVCDLRVAVASHVTRSP